MVAPLYHLIIVSKSETQNHRDLNIYASSIFQFSSFILNVLQPCLASSDPTHWVYLCSLPLSLLQVEWCSGVFRVNVLPVSFPPSAFGFLLSVFHGTTRHWFYASLYQCSLHSLSILWLINATIRVAFHVCHCSEVSVQQMFAEK